MDKSLLSHINTIESSLSTLVTSLTTTNSFSAAPNAAQTILTADKSLQQALVTLKQHQDNYQRILKLREEANQLQTHLRDVIKTCVQYRTEIGEIDSSILEDDDDEGPLSKSTTTQKQSVDYETLLSFAARIGKHNALAARAAEDDAVKRRSEARAKREAAAAKLANGQDRAMGDSAMQTQSQTQTQESAANLAAIDEQLSAAHAYNGMAFPAPDVLRVGALGQLQLLAEQSGEDAVMKEVQRLVGISELGITGEEVKEEEERKPSIIPGLGEESDTRNVEEKAAVRPKPRQMSVIAAAPKRKAVSLDFPDSDEEED